MDALTRHVHTNDNYEYQTVCKTVSEAAERHERIRRTFAKISDPRNAHLFTTDAARKAFAHVELPSHEEAEIARRREERMANIVIWGSALGMLIAFVLAVLAIVFMK